MQVGNIQQLATDINRISTYDLRTVADKQKDCMSLKNDKWIRKMAAQGMITPFVDGKVRAVDGKPVISYGCSSFGYDMRLADEFLIFTPSTGQMTVVDPKAMDPAAMVSFKGDTCIIPPNSFALARSVEYFKMPANVLGLCLGKSTYARVGIVTNFTPFEPGWCGTVTIEISNTTPLPAKIYANEGIAQVLFFEGEEPTAGYGEGKYQRQTGITLARV